MRNEDQKTNIKIKKQKYDIEIIKIIEDKETMKTILENEINRMQQENIELNNKLENQKYQIITNLDNKLT